MNLLSSVFALFGSEAADLDDAAVREYYPLVQVLCCLLQSDSQDGVQGLNLSRFCAETPGIKIGA